MKIINCLFLNIILALMCIILTSCWNYHELENYEIVTGISLDKNGETNKYTLTFEIIEIIVGKTESMIDSKIVQSEGDSVFDAVRNAIMETGRKLYFGHAKVFIISREIAEEGIFPVLDWINRDHETRHNIDIFISEEDCGDIFFKSKEKSQDIIAYSIVEEIISQEQVSKAPEGTLWLFLNLVEADDTSGILPVISFKENRGNHIPQISGTAVFKKDKLIGILDEDDSKTLLFIRDSIKGGLFIIENVYDELYYNVVFEIYNNKTKIKPAYEGDSISMDIKTKTNVSLSENMGSKNFEDVDSRKELEKIANNELKTKIIRLIDKVKNEYKVDIFGFGEMLKNKEPKVWDKVKNNWDEIFTSIDVKVECDFTIRSTGFSSRPLIPAR